MPFVKAIAVIDNIVNNFGFGFVVLGHSLYAALIFNPMHCFVDHVDGKNRRGIVKGIVVSKGGVFKHGGQIFASRCQKFFLGDNDNYACWTQIFLRSSINQIKIGYIYLARQDIAGHITNHRHIKFRKFFVFRAVNRIIGSDVYIGGVRLQGEFSRYVAMIFVGAGGCFIGFTKEFGFGHSFFGPYAGVYIGSIFFNVEIGSGH